MKNLLRIGISCLVFGMMTSCVPASISRIGPLRPPRKTSCEIEVLAPSLKPSRPWVDIGVVLVQNCQEYHVGLCRKWIVQKACELGGEIAYLPNPKSPQNEKRDNINYRVLVAVYASTNAKVTDPPSVVLKSMEGCTEPKAEPDSKSDENENRCTE